MTNQKKAPNSKKDELQTYFSVGIVFLVVGLAMLAPEGTRATGIPFLILGLTFFALSKQEPESKRKK